MLKQKNDPSLQIMNGQLERNSVATVSRAKNGRRHATYPRLTPTDYHHLWLTFPFDVDQQHRRPSAGAIAPSYQRENFFTHPPLPCIFLGESPEFEGV